MSNKSSRKALGENISAKQRLTEDIPKKELILKSHKSDISKMWDMKNLPEEIMVEIRNHNLYDKWLTMQKMLWNPTNYKEPVEHLLSFIARHGTVNANSGEMMKPMTVKSKK